MGHILLHCACHVLGKGLPFLDGIREFNLHSLPLEPPPPALIVDHLLIISLALRLHIDDLLVVDR